VLGSVGLRSVHLDGFLDRLGLLGRHLSAS